jgi:hypothetical protein
VKWCERERGEAIGVVASTQCPRKRVGGEMMGDVGGGERGERRGADRGSSGVRSRVLRVGRV